MALGRIECQTTMAADSTARRARPAGKRRTRRSAGAARDGRDSAAADPDAGGAGGLDDRKAAILNAVVSEYIETAQPVGSTHISETPGVEVSSATVRSEMAALEREGYLVQPHTSAGRIPTDKGYRFFVDHLGRPGTLGPHERQRGPQVLHPRPRRGGGAPGTHERAARRSHGLRRRGGGPEPRVGDDPVGATGRPRPARGACWWSSSPTAPSRSGPSSWRRASTTTCWPRPPRI